MPDRYYVTLYGNLISIHSSRAFAEIAKKKYIRDNELEGDDEDCVEIYPYKLGQDLSNNGAL